jgi:PhnB protein
MAIQPYLFFEGRCDEAIEFYRRVLGAEVVMLMRNGESPGPTAHGPAEKVMHATLRIGLSTLLVSDGRCDGQPNFQGFGLSLTVPSEAEAERTFAALGEGGRVVEPLAQTFFSPRFGMVVDRFGVLWMIWVGE